jgi:Methyltransferase domain
MGSRSTPEHWDFTLLPFAGIVRRLLDAVGARSVVEVGADRGEFTVELLEWAAASGATVTAVDPEPARELLELYEGHSELRLVRQPSLEALPALLPQSAVILDGDHNYYTVSEELRLIAEGSSAAEMPLLILHDVGWPHGRRDTYYVPERIPEDRRQPLARDALIAPGNPGLAEQGIRFPWAAEREGGPRNGVMTAVEDFLADGQGLRMAVVPAFFGLGVIWSEQAQWAEAVAEAVDPWDSNEMLERLEDVRIGSIVEMRRLGRQEQVLRELLNSRALSVAERLSAIWGRGGGKVSRERIRRALSE